MVLFSVAMGSYLVTGDVPGTSTGRHSPPGTDQLVTCGLRPLLRMSVAVVHFGTEQIIRASSADMLLGHGSLHRGQNFIYHLPYAEKQ